MNETRRGALSPSDVAQRTEFRHKLEEKLNPHKELILYLDAILLWEQPPVIGGIVLGVYFLIWFTFGLINSCSFITLASLVAGFAVVFWKVGRLPPIPRPALSPHVPGKPQRHEYDHILEFLVSAYFLFYNFYAIVKHKILNINNLDALRLGVFFGFLAFLGTIFSTSFFIYVIVLGLLLAPGIIGHNLHVLAWSKAEPHWRKVQPKVGPYLDTVVTQSRRLSGWDEVLLQQTVTVTTQIQETPKRVESSEDFVEINKD